jgi:hypothetical protein
MARAVTLADIEAIEHACRADALLVEDRVALIVVDPLMAYLPTDSDAHVDQDVRAVLGGLAAVAARTGAAIVAVRHLAKRPGGPAIYRGGGSIGIIAAARSALVVGADPTDPTGERRVLAATKCNLAARPASLAYRIEAPDGVPRIAWMGELAVGADALLAPPEAGDEGGALGEAVEWLRSALASGEPIAASDLHARAAAEQIAERTLRRAARALGIANERTGYPARATWRLPQSGQSGQGAQPGRTDGEASIATRNPQPCRRPGQDPQSGQPERATEVAGLDVPP